MSVRTTDVAAFVPSGHPVRRFVLVVTAICAVLALVWWSGFANPRVTVSHVASTYDEETGRAVVRAEVRNANRSALELHAATLDDPWLQVRSARFAGNDIQRRPTLGAHDAEELELTFSVDCVALAEQQRLDPRGTIYSDELLRIRVQAVLGGQRTRTTRVRGALNTVIAQACPGL